MSPHDSRIGHAGIPVPDDLPRTRRSNGAGPESSDAAARATGAGGVVLDPIEAIDLALDLDLGGLLKLQDAFLEEFLVGAGLGVATDLRPQ